MNIGIVLYPINDLGGIINHVENLAFGLREIGHQVNLHILYYQEHFRQPYPDRDLLKRGWVNGAFCVVNQQSGWNAVPWKHKLSYKGEKNINRTKEILSKYDLVIWEVPVPSKSKINQGNSDWLSLYGACQKSVAILHDGNLFNIPWIFGVRKYFTGIACVHECAYNLGRNLDIPRSLILNPQDLSGIEEVYDYRDREPGFLSLQVFKSWKHVDDLIRAIPHISSDIKKYVAGGGIEQRYMVAKEKTKDKYFCRMKEDPDLPMFLENSGTKIWDRARYHGMNYLGFISPFRRDVILSGIRTLIDSSWSRKYNEYGSHFNRVIVDAIKRGTIPIAINLGMSDDYSGEGSIFKPNENYIMIPYDATPKEYAKIIEYANSRTEHEAEAIVSNNYDLMYMFDRRKVAQDFINLSMGQSCGFFNKRVKGKANPELRKASNKGIKFFRKKVFK